MTKTKEELITELISKLKEINDNDTIEGADEFLSGITLDMTDSLDIEQIANLALPNFKKEDLERYIAESNELLTGSDDT